MSKTYEVGQVIWVVGSERPGLRVFQVVEEVTKKDFEWRDYELRGCVSFK